MALQRIGFTLVALYASGASVNCSAPYMAVVTQKVTKKLRSDIDLKIQPPSDVVL